MSSHWFRVIFPLVQIGCCDNIGFGFTTLNRKAPYKLLFHTSFTVNNSSFELLPFNNWCLLSLIPPLDRLAFVMDTLGKNSFAFPPVFHSPFLCSDFLSTLWASVHVISVQCVFDRHFVQWFLDNKIQLSFSTLEMFRFRFTSLCDWARKLAPLCLQIRFKSERKISLINISSQTTHGLTISVSLIHQKTVLHKGSSCLPQCIAQNKILLWSCWRVNSPANERTPNLSAEIHRKH